MGTRTLHESYGLGEYESYGLGEQFKISLKIFYWKFQNLKLLQGKGVRFERELVINYQLHDKRIILGLPNGNPDLSFEYKLLEFIGLSDPLTCNVERLEREAAEAARKACLQQA